MCAVPLAKDNSVRYLWPDPAVRYIEDGGLYKEGEERNADEILAPLQRYTSTKCCWVPDEEDKQLETKDNNVISELVPLVPEDLTDPAGPSTAVAGSSSGIDQGGMDASPETTEENSPIGTNSQKSNSRRWILLTS